MSQLQRQRRRRHRGNPFLRILAFVLGGALLAVVGGIVGAVIWVVSTADSAPNLDQLKPRVAGQLSTVYAADGSLLGYISNDIIRRPLSQHQQPALLRDATVAIEDRRFFQHGGVDYQGVIRAGVRDIFSPGRGVQGGSTLTMQLVGNVYLQTNFKNHGLVYKIKQAKLANQLEAKHTKDWILTQYLNDVPYGAVGGQQAIGVGAAAQMFFNRPVSRLSLAQIALLAGLPQAPTAYNPFLHPALAKWRRGLVLTAMAQAGYISQAQAQAAAASPLQVHADSNFGDIKQPYVFDFIREQLVKKLGQATVDRGGLKVYTTLNETDQAYAQQALAANEDTPGDPDAALVSVDPANGHIVAMAQNSVYGVDPKQPAGLSGPTLKTTVNWGAHAHRQSGSSFKPFVMMAMIHDDDGDPNLTYYDSKELFPGWLPEAPSWHVQTSEKSYQGVINITKAMTLSDNTVFAQLGADVGVDNYLRMAYEMGITTRQQPNEADAIGGLNPGVTPLEMADAYATIDNGGSHYDATILDHVVGPGGKVIQGTDPHPDRVFSDGQAYAGTQVLKTVVGPSGTGASANYGCPAAGKTGTTSNFVDAWFVGYTPSLSTSVWVGYTNEGQSMTDVNGLGEGFGGTLAAPIWKAYMQKASPTCTPFPQPTVPWRGTPYLGAHSASAGHATNYTYTGPSAAPATPAPATPAPTATAPTATAPAKTPAKPTGPTHGHAANPGHGNAGGHGAGNGNGNAAPPPAGAPAGPTGGAGLP